MSEIVPAAPGTVAILESGERRIVIAFRCIGNEAVPVTLAEGIVLSTDTRERKDNVG